VVDQQDHQKNYAVQMLPVYAVIYITVWLAAEQVLAELCTQHGTITAVTVFVFLTTMDTPITIGQELPTLARPKAEVDQFSGQTLAAVHGKANVFRVFG
jgi:hypothetical protein